jgi:hypothetical protein
LVVRPLLALAIVVLAVSAGQARVLPRAIGRRLAPALLYLDLRRRSRRRAIHQPATRLHRDSRHREVAGDQVAALQLAQILTPEGFTLQVGVDDRHGAAPHAAARWISPGQQGRRLMANK